MVLGAVVAAAPPDSAALCPVALAQRLLTKGKYAEVDKEEPAALLVRGVAATPKRDTEHCLRGPLQGLSYSALLAKAKAAFREFGGTDNFALHCLRIGGATEAARAEVPDRLRLEQGGWKSEVTLRRYTRDTLEARLGIESFYMVIQP